MIHQIKGSMGKFSRFTLASRKHIALMWAVAVMWIYLGNIINFHQHHIWGKQLIPVAATSQRSKEKLLSIQHSGPTSNLKVHHVNLVFSEATAPVQLLSFSGDVVTIQLASDQLPHLAVPNFNSLRAPPVL